jgi:hypothetical protein
LHSTTGMHFPKGVFQWAAAFHIDGPSLTIHRISTQLLLVAKTTFCLVHQQKESRIVPITRPWWEIAWIYPASAETSIPLTLEISLSKGLLSSNFSRGRHWLCSSSRTARRNYCTARCALNPIRWLRACHQPPSTGRLSHHHNSYRHRWMA